MLQNKQRWLSKRTVTKTCTKRTICDVCFLCFFWLKKKAAPSLKSVPHSPALSKSSTHYYLCSIISQFLSLISIPSPVHPCCSLKLGYNGSLIRFQHVFLPFIYVSPLCFCFFLIFLSVFYHLQLLYFHFCFCSFLSFFLLLMTTFLWFSYSVISASLSCVDWPILSTPELTKCFRTWDYDICPALFFLFIDSE